MSAPPRGRKRGRWDGAERTRSRRLSRRPRRGQRAGCDGSVMPRRGWALELGAGVGRWSWPPGGGAPGGDAPSERRERQERQERQERRERRERQEMQANATIILGLQVLLSLLTYAIIARAYLWPRLAGLPLRVALPPLLLFNTFRTLGLVFLLPGVVGDTLPAEFAVPAAVGNSAAVALAFLALGA